MWGGGGGALSTERLQVARCPPCHRGFLVDALQLGSVLCHRSVAGPRRRLRRPWLTRFHCRSSCRAARQVQAASARRRQRKQALQVLSVVVAVRRWRQRKQALQVLSAVVAVRRRRRQRKQVLSVVVAVEASPSKTSKSIFFLAHFRVLNEGGQPKAGAACGSGRAGLCKTRRSS